MDKVKSVFLESIKLMVDLNFLVSIGVLIIGCAFSASPEHSFFDFNEELFGALVNNLRIMMLYLAVTECVILLYCFFTKKYQFTVLIGFFLILMIGSLQFYGEVNNVEIDKNLPLFFLYVGLSHLIFGVKTSLVQSFSAGPQKSLLK